MLCFKIFSFRFLLFFFNLKELAVCIFRPRNFYIFDYSHVEFIGTYLRKIEQIKRSITHFLQQYELKIAICLTRD